MMCNNWMSDTVICHTNVTAVIYKTKGDLTPSAHPEMFLFHSND